MKINIICPDCSFSKKVSEEKIPEGIKLVKCPRCGNIFELPRVVDQDAASQQNDDLDFIDKSKPDYEIVEPDEIGYFTGLWKTLTGVLASPSKFFSGVKNETGLANSLAFGILLGSIGAMLGLFLQFILQSQEMSYITNLMPESISINHIFLTLIIISPITVLINALIVTVVLHLFLLILRGANKGFEGTFRVVLYSNATSVFNLIPFIGGFIAFFWNCSVLVIGLREVHETTTFRALFSLLLPLFFFLFLFFAVAIYFASLFLK